SRATRVHSRQDAERELKAAKALGVAFVALGEPDYPPRLQMIDDAPPLLAVRGQTAVLHLPAVPARGASHGPAPGPALGRRAARRPRRPSRPPPPPRAPPPPPPFANAPPPPPPPRPPAPTIISTRANTPSSPTPPGRRALWSRKRRSPTTPARAFPPAATAHF